MVENARADSLDRFSVENKYTKDASRVPIPAKLTGKNERIFAKAIKIATLRYDKGIPIERTIK